MPPITAVNSFGLLFTRSVEAGGGAYGGTLNNRTLTGNSAASVAVGPASAKAPRANA